MIASNHIPEAIAADVARGESLARWTLFWIGGVAILMYLVTGSSQAMKSAFLEDVLSLIPSFAFLVATRFEKVEASSRFPYGLKRVNSLAFLIAAVALISIGGFLAIEALMTLVMAEHATIESVSLFGRSIWLGWVMVAVLIYSAVPPLILGHKKLPVARTINDKVLHTDALTQKADWQTALVGVLGIIGIGLGWWWADATAALFISASILKDGVGAISKAASELIDGMPQRLDKAGIAEDALHLQARLADHYPDATIRIRESGRYMLAQVVGAPSISSHDAKDLMPPGRSWRLSQVSFVPQPNRPDGAEAAVACV